jgi:toxin ParE1/3/4
LRIQFRRLAVSDLKAIGQWGVEQWGEDRTDTFLADMRQAIDQLLEFPLMGKRQSTLNPRLRSISHAGYLIFYTVESEGPTIVRVLHERRNQAALDFSDGAVPKPDA